MKFKDLALGDVFKTPTGRQLYRKRTGHSARVNGTKRDVLVNPETEVLWVFNDGGQTLFGGQS